MATAFERLQEVTAQVLAVKKEEVTLESTLNSLGADSLDTAELLMETETEFDIKISDDDFKKWITFGDMLNFLKEKGIKDE